MSGTVPSTVGLGQRSGQREKHKRNANACSSFKTQLDPHIHCDTFAAPHPRSPWSPLWIILTTVECPCVAGPMMSAFPEYPLYFTVTLRDPVILPVLQMRTVRLREVQGCGQGHTAKLVSGWAGDWAQARDSRACPLVCLLCGPSHCCGIVCFLVRLCCQTLSSSQAGSLISPALSGSQPGPGTE